MGGDSLSISSEPVGRLGTSVFGRISWGTVETWGSAFISPITPVTGSDGLSISSEPVGRIAASVSGWISGGTVETWGSAFISPITPVTGSVGVSTSFGSVYLNSPGPWETARRPSKGGKPGCAISPTASTSRRPVLLVISSISLSLVNPLPGTCSISAPTSSSSPMVDPFPDLERMKNLKTNNRPQRKRTRRVIIMAQNQVFSNIDLSGTFGSFGVSFSLTVTSISRCSLAPGWITCTFSR